MFARAFSATAFVLALPILAAASTFARADAASCSEGTLQCCQVINTNSSLGLNCIDVGYGEATGYICGAITACCTGQGSDPVSAQVVPSSSPNRQPTSTAMGIQPYFSKSFSVLGRVRCV